MPDLSFFSGARQILDIQVIESMLQGKKCNRIDESSMVTLNSFTATY